MSSRRHFVATAAAGLAANAAEGIRKRPLGKTGLQVSILGFGGAGIGVLPDSGPATDVVRRCLDLGVNYFDAAASGAYGLSQVRYGQALRGARDRIVIGTKTRHRTYTQAEVDLNQSLSWLGTDHIDIYQLHNITNDEDIEFIFGPHGVMELVEKAKKGGKIRFVGVTGHTDPAVMNRIISRYNFDTILMPLSVADGANKQLSFERDTLPLARKKNMGIIAMKTLGAGRILKDNRVSAAECLGYAFTLPVSTAILGCRTVAEVDAGAAQARTAKPLSAAEMERLRDRLAGERLASLEPWKRRDGIEPSQYRAD